MGTEGGFVLVVLLALTLVRTSLGAKDRDLYCGGTVCCNTVLGVVVFTMKVASSASHGYQLRVRNDIARYYICHTTKMVIIFSLPYYCWRASMGNQPGRSQENSWGTFPTWSLFWQFLNNFPNFAICSLRIQPPLIAHRRLGRSASVLSRWMAQAAVSDERRLYSQAMLSVTGILPLWIGKVKAQNVSHAMFFSKWQPLAGLLVSILTCCIKGRLSKKSFVGFHMVRTKTTHDFLARDQKRLAPLAKSLHQRLKKSQPKQCWWTCDCWVNWINNEKHYEGYEANR